MLLIHIFWATLLDYWQTTDRQMGLDWTDIYFDCFDSDMTTYDRDLDATDTTDWLYNTDFIVTCNIASPAFDPHPPPSPTVSSAPTANHSKSLPANSLVSLLYYHLLMILDSTMRRISNCRSTNISWFYYQICLLRSHTLRAHDSDILV